MQCCGGKNSPGEKGHAPLSLSGFEYVMLLVFRCLMLFLDSSVTVDGMGMQK